MPIRQDETTVPLGRVVGHYHIEVCSSCGAEEREQHRPRCPLNGLHIGTVTRRCPIYAYGPEASPTEETP